MHDVLPLLQRAGCSSAYCHGSATGRAGFRLSLFGSDAAADYQAITAQLGGRRIDLRDPARSLIVQKALGKLEHGGGRRFAPASVGHQQMQRWIAAGAPWRSAVPMVASGLDLTIVAGRVVATATFRDSDGVPAKTRPEKTTRDVSDVALFSTTDPTVVEVDASGALTFHGPGLAHVVARYANLSATVRLVRPWSEVSASTLPAQSEHALTTAWRWHLHELGLQPAATITAQQLARRLHLDLVGRPPTPRELDEFVAACQHANNRADTIRRVVRELSARREFAEVWGGRLAEWFELFPKEQRGPAAEAAARWRTTLVQCVADGQTLPTIARRLVLGQQDDGRFAAGMVDRFGDARDRAEYVGRTLLGMRIGCARCHDHPSDRWRQAEHLAFSACFAPPRADGAGGMMTGTLFDAGSGEQVDPRFLALTKNSATVPGEETRRAGLAQFLLSSDHDAFATNASNRIFAEVFGRALVEPVDEHRVGNPPLDADMLAVLVAQFHAVDGRLPDLLAFLMTSQAYLAGSRQSTPTSVKHLAAQASRPLPPATFVRALTSVLGRAPAVRLPDMALARELALRNGPIVHEVLKAGGTTIDATFELCATPRERVVELWRTVLSREPRAAELKSFLPQANELAAFRDLAFALLAGREFGHRR